MSTNIPDGEKRFALELYEPISDKERREITRMIQHALDGDPVFAVEGYDPEPEDLDRIERFVEEELRGDG